MRRSRFPPSLLHHSQHILRVLPHQPGSVVGVAATDGVEDREVLLVVATTVVVDSEDRELLGGVDLDAS